MSYEGREAMLKGAEALRAEFELIDKQLSARDRAAFAIEQAKADTAARSQEVYEKDFAGYPERCRAQRHHDVLCIMLKEITRANAAAGCMNVNSDIVFQQAKAMADLAYPPPKAQP